MKFLPLRLITFIGAFVVLVIAITIPVALILALFQSQISLIIGACLESLGILLLIARKYPSIQYAIEHRKEMGNLPGLGGLILAMVNQLIVSITLWTQPVYFNWSYPDRWNRWIYYSIQGMAIVLFELVVFLIAYMSIGVIAHIQKQNHSG
jgi:hypothetical protein